MLIPTLDSVRANYLMETMLFQKDEDGNNTQKNVLIIGEGGTAKSSTILMFCNTHKEEMLIKQTNFSSATTPTLFQLTVEGELESKGSNNVPKDGKEMILFLDDMSMPKVNDWGDQVTLELERQVLEQKGFQTLKKDDIGKFMQIQKVQYVGGMNTPGAGKNDIPNRLKRHFFAFTMVMPSKTTVDNIYGQMLKIG